MAEATHFAADPGGIFASDVHRRVLAHLTTPSEDIGFTPDALLARLDPDQHTPVDEQGVATVLKELEKDELAVVHEGDVWQQSEKGFELLTGPIADEPEAGATPQTPARLDAPTLISDGKAD